MSDEGWGVIHSWEVCSKERGSRKESEGWGMRHTEGPPPPHRKFKMLYFRLNILYSYYSKRTWFLIKIKFVWSNWELPKSFKVRWRHRPVLKTNVVIKHNPCSEKSQTNTPVLRNREKCCLNFYTVFPVNVCKIQGNLAKLAIKIFEHTKTNLAATLYLYNYMVEMCK